MKQAQEMGATELGMTGAKFVVDYCYRAEEPPWTSGIRSDLQQGIKVIHGLFLGGIKAMRAF